MSETSRAYRALAVTAKALLPFAAPFSSKLAEGDQGRRQAIGRWAEWAATSEPARPLLWVHAPSVGEGLQANEVLGILRSRHPEWRMVYTFFSPSAASLATRQPVDHADYLPYDTPADVGAMLSALKPRALVFTKLDLWPELATRARASGVRVGMIAATVSAVSRRLHPVVRRLAWSGYHALERVGAIDHPDASRLEALGVSRGTIVITGDPRFDSALRRAREATNHPLRHLTASSPTLVAGSTWPGDEIVLLTAFATVLETHPGARLIVVPHEPTAGHLDRLERKARARRLRPRRLSALGPAEAPPLVIIDRVGVLAGLYTNAAIAYVGGGFGSAGLHSVLEPAACGIPVTFGPRWQSSREAGLLLAAKAGLALPGAVPVASSVLAEWWRAALDEPDQRTRAGKAALAMVHNEIGAASRSADVVELLMA